MINLHRRAMISAAKSRLNCWDGVTVTTPALVDGYYQIVDGATLTNFDLSAVTSWIGSAPTIEADTTYELDVLDGVGVCSEVSA